MTCRALHRAGSLWVTGELFCGAAGQVGSEQLADLVQQRMHGCHCGWLGA